MSPISSTPGQAEQHNQADQLQDRERHHRIPDDDRRGGAQLRPERGRHR